LYQKRYCTHIRMRLQSKSKVWLWTRRIIANCGILINFSNRIFYIRWWQVQTSRDDTQQSLSKIFHVVAVFHNSIPANATCISFCVSGKKDIWCNVLTGMKIWCLSPTGKSKLNWIISTMLLLSKKPVQQQSVTLKWPHFWIKVQIT